MIRTSSIAGLVLGCTFAGSVAADGFEFDTGNMYAGGGVSNNSVSGFDDAFGFQIFGGYNFGELFGVENLDFLVEAGFMNTDDFEASTFFGTVTTSHSGLWSTGGVAYRMNEQLSFIGRIGLDFGDDDGLMFGGGAAYHLNPNLELRGELVERDNIRSIQFNAAYHF
jgi:hypothetical protein